MLKRILAMALGVGDWIFIVICGLVILFAVVSNFLVIFIFFRCNKMKNVTNAFICNLAVSDIVLGGIILPQKLHDLSHDEEYHEGEFLCKFVNAVPLFCISCSIYTMTAVSFERRRSIVQSLQTQITLQTCKVIIPCTWVLAFITCIPSIVEFSVSTIQSENGTTYMSCGSHKVPKSFSVANGVGLLLFAYVVPLCLIWYNYLLIIRFVLQRTNQAEPKGIHAQELTAAAKKSSHGNLGKSRKQTSMQLLVVPKDANISPPALKLEQNKMASMNSEVSDITVISQGNSGEHKGSRSKTLKGKTTTVVHKKKMNIIKMLIIVAALFAVCWSPYFVSLLTAKIQGTDDSDNAKSGLNLLNLSLAVISTGYNVIIYVIFNSNFREAFKKLAFRCRRGYHGQNSVRPANRGV